MFKYDEYWPFMIGVFALGGFIAVPLIWSQFSDLSYAEAIPGSLLGCGVFAYAHTRNGEFKTGRLIAAMAVAFLFMLRASASRRGTQLILPGGFLGFIVMAASGWVGVQVARLTGFSSGTEQPQNLESLPDPANFDEQATKLVAEAQEPNLARFLASSHIAWKGGHLNALSSAYGAEANKSDMESFIMANSRGHLDAFNNIDSKEPFEQGEYLVGWTESFVITNRRLCIFTESIPTGTVEIFPFSEIAHYKTTSGWLKHSIHLTLADGRSLEFAGLKNVPQDRYLELLIAAAKAKHGEGGTSDCAAGAAGGTPS